MFWTLPAAPTLIVSAPAPLLIKVYQGARDVDGVIAVAGVHKDRGNARGQPARRVAIHIDGDVIGAGADRDGIVAKVARDIEVGRRGDAAGYHVDFVGAVPIGRAELNALQVRAVLYVGVVPVGGPGIVNRARGGGKAEDRVILGHLGVVTIRGSCGAAGELVAIDRAAGQRGAIDLGNRRPPRPALAAIRVVDIELIRVGREEHLAAGQDQHPVFEHAAGEVRPGGRD